MDKDDPAKHQQHEAEQYLRHTRDAFSFNPSTGLHQPKSAIPKNKVYEHCHPSIQNQTPLPTSRPNWADMFQGLGAIFGIGIGFFTLVLLFFTVCWARKQWEAMDRTAAAAIYANKTAQEAVKQAGDQFLLDRRPWVGFLEVNCVDCVERMEDHTDPAKHVMSMTQFFKVGDLNGAIANSGKTPAVQMKIRAVITTLNETDPIPTIDSLTEQSRRIKKGLPGLQDERLWLIPIVVIGPNSTRQITFALKSEWGREFFAPPEKRHVLYIVGKITYFGTDSPRRKDPYETTFCIKNDTFYAGNSFSYCSTGNNMK